MLNLIKDIGNRLVTVYHATLTNLGSRKKVDAMNKETLMKVKNGEIKLTILLHGMFANYYRNMYSTIKLLKKYGVNVVSLEWGYKDPLEESAEEIREKIEEMMKETGVKEIDILGMCFGGTVARYYIEELDGKRHIGNFVTIHSPVKPIFPNEFGYKLNKFLGGDPKLCNQGLRQIKNKCSTKNHLFLYSLDGKIILPKYSIIKGANQKGLTEPHIFSTFNPRVLKVVVEFLKQDKR